MPLRDQNLTVLPRFSVMRRKPFPLGLEDPSLVVEGFVDKRREHRSIRGIHAFPSGITSYVHFTRNGFPPRLKHQQLRMFAND